MIRYEYKWVPVLDRTQGRRPTVNDLNNASTEGWRVVPMQQVNGFMLMELEATWKPPEVQS